MFDSTIHLGDLVAALGMGLGLGLGGWRIAITFRDQIVALRATVYGSHEPPVEGLVAVTQRHDKALLDLRSRR